MEEICKERKDKKRRSKATDPEDEEPKKRRSTATDPEDEEPKKRRSKATDPEDEEPKSDDEDRAAKKGRKVALRATRRLARVLGVKLKSGSDEDDDADDDEQPGPFEPFPSRKEARKLSEAHREALVERLTSMSERVVALSSKLVDRYGGSAGKGGIGGTGLEVGVDAASQAKRAKGAFEQADMWRQLSAVSRRCCDAAISSAAAANSKHIPERAPEHDAHVGEEDGGLGASKMAGNKEPIGGRTFKEWYLDKFTDAFADDLDKIRVQELEGGKVSNIGTLIDAVVAGMDVIPHLERAVCLTHFD